MSKDYSPFTPGQPVPLQRLAARGGVAVLPVFAVGRAQEIERVLRSVRAATAGKLQVLFLTGERGIGKSSLAAYVRALAERDHAALAWHTFLGGVDTLEEAVVVSSIDCLKRVLAPPGTNGLKSFLGIISGKWGYLE